MSKNFDELQEKALYIKNFYAQKQKTKGRDPWTVSDYMAGFVADVGELSEFIMAKQGLRDIEEVDEKLKHELSDCLYSIIAIADELDIDLPVTFSENMDKLAVRIEQKGK